MVWPMEVLAAAGDTVGVPLRAPLLPTVPSPSSDSIAAISLHLHHLWGPADGLSFSKTRVGGYTHTLGRTVPLL